MYYRCTAEITDSVIRRVGVGRILPPVGDSRRIRCLCPGRFRSRRDQFPRYRFLAISICRSTVVRIMPAPAVSTCRGGQKLFRGEKPRERGRVIRLVVDSVAPNPPTRCEGDTFGRLFSLCVFVGFEVQQGALSAMPDDFESAPADARSYSWYPRRSYVESFDTTPLYESP